MIQQKIILRNGIGSRLGFWFILISVGFILHYYSQTNPWQSLKNDIGRMLGYNISPKKSSNYSDTMAVATESSASSSGIQLPDIFGEESGKTPADGELDYRTVLEPYLPAIKKNDQIIWHKGYVLNYAEQYEQAAWVLHQVTGKVGKAKRAENFMPDPDVATGSALPSDYAHSGYDRGHLAPAGDFKYDQALTYETFFMSNMSPQLHALNIGIWNDLEQDIRRWAKKRGVLMVLTGPVLKAGLPTIGRHNKIAIPEAYYKIVFDTRSNQAIGFVLPNKFVNDLLVNYTQSIDQIEKLTGIDFFAKINKTTEKNIEAQNNPDDWF